MQRNILLGLTLIASAWPGLAGGATNSLQDHLLNPFSASVLNAFALQKGECPPTYVRITNTNLLAQAGITRNLDYLTRRSDLEDVIQMHAGPSD